MNEYYDGFLKPKKKKNIFINERNKKNTFSLVLICAFLSVILLTSYSAFIYTSEQRSVDITVGDLSYTLTSSALTNGALTINSKSQNRFNITLTASNVIQSKYELYYEVYVDGAWTKNPVDNLVVEYSDSNENKKGTISATGNKIIKIVVINFTNTNYQIRFSVNGGYVHNDYDSGYANITGPRTEADVETDWVYIGTGTAPETFPLTAAAAQTADLSVINVTCVDGNGFWKTTDWKLSVAITTSPMSCRVTLEKRGDSLVNVVKSASGILNENGYRYQGSNPSNYISFNNETWRIIGVFDEDDHGIADTELVKIIRNDSIGTIAWDSSNTNNWATSSLNTYLNGTSVSDYYGSIDSTYKSMIKEVTWYLGGMSGASGDLNYYQTPASNWYTYERGSIVYSGRPTSTVEKIGLMYMSDYGYASSGCYSNTNLTSYNSSTCTGSNWLFKGDDEWTIVSSSSYSGSVWSVYTGGSASSSYARYGYATRPVLYLDSSVYFVDGNGSENNPYIIGDDLKYTITKGIETNGTFTIDKNISEAGETVTITPTPATGYIVSSVLVNGSATGVTNNGSNYTFTMPTENVIVRVIFVIPEPLVNVVKNTNGILNENGYRYQGTSPDNYIIFNNETWRIIGVFDEDNHGIADTELVKIIRNDSIGNMAWYSRLNNNWQNSSLKSYLNGNNYYGSINVTFRNMIEQVTWYLGGKSNDPYSYDALTSSWYTTERSSSVYTGNPLSTVGNIGLMYMSDYGYASSECYSSISLNAYNSSTCIQSNWLLKGINEWSIMHSSNSSQDIWYVSSGGRPMDNTTTTTYGVRPVLYLDSSVYVISGVGSSESPYTIGM